MIETTITPHGITGGAWQAYATCMTFGKSAPLNEAAGYVLIPVKK